MISQNNIRILLTLPKELKNELEKLAKKENRSLNNYILNELIKSIKKTTPPE